MDTGLLGSYLPLFASAAWLTVWVGLSGIVAAVAVGMMAAAVQHFHVPVARQLVAGYVEVSRNTPLVVQLFFLYFGLPKLGLVLEPATCAIVGLAFQGGSYMAETFRSALESVPRDQSLSALSLGLGRGSVLARVVVPQAVPHAMPGLTANMIFLLKETSVVSIVALPDLMYVAKDLLGTDYNTTETLGLLVACYLVILLPVSLGAAMLERRSRHAFGS